jgi:hypothetical protein
MLQPTSSADELAAHLDRVPPVAIFVSQDLLTLGQDALQKSSLSAVLPFYRLLVASQTTRTASAEPNQDLSKIPTLNDLIAAAKDLPPVERTPLSAGEASRRVAYYCTTSGTSGFQVFHSSLLVLCCAVLTICYCDMLASCRSHARKHHCQRLAGWTLSRRHQGERPRGRSGIPSIQPHLWNSDHSYVHVARR